MARSRENKIELTAYNDLFVTDESHIEANLSKIIQLSKSLYRGKDTNDLQVISESYGGTRYRKSREFIGARFKVLIEI